MRWSLTARLRASRQALLPTALLVAGTLACGVFAGHLVTQRTLAQDVTQADEQLRLYADSLRRYIDRYRTLPAVLALDPELRAALSGTLTKATQARLNQRLEEVNGVTQASTLTLIDRSGLSVAASNWHLPGSNVGYHYAFRPYFQDAVANGHGSFYGVGATTGVPGYFISEAVHGAGGEVLGVVVIKLDLRELETQWASSRDLILLSDEHGVVFLANREAWRYRELHVLSADDARQITRTRQYGDLPLRPLVPQRRLPDDSKQTRLRFAGPDGQPYDVLWQHLPMPRERWTLHLLQDCGPALLAGRIAGGGVWLALLLLALFVQSRLRLSRLRRRSREELEQMVKQHAAALRTTRDGVVEAARRSALGQSASLEHLPQGVSVIDAELRLVSWNRRYVEFFRYPPELMQVGRPIEDLFRFNAQRGLLGDGNEEAAIRRRLEHLRAGTPYLHERERPDGTVLEIRGNPLPGGGFVTSYADITQYKNVARDLRTLAGTLERRIEARTHDLALAKGEAERANLYKTRFIAAAVHDLLQPLNAARMFISALRNRGGDGDGDGESRTLLDNVDESLAAQDALLSGLLDISRLESGTLEIKRRNLKLGNLLEMLAREFGVLAQSRGLALHYLPTRAVVHTDEDLLRRIVQNFLSNAIRYTPRGRVILGCRRAGDSVRIEVWDSGIGIPEAQRRAIFEEFRRLDTGRNASERGAGLGLAIVERVARLLGHPVQMRSWPGRGSVFSVSVPLGDPAAVADTPKPALPPGDDSPLRGLRGWCIDDDARVREGTRALLESWGSSVTLHASTEEALTAASAGAVPDFLLLDYRLGTMTGPECVPGLFERWQRAVPIIVISAERDPELQALVRKHGWGFLAKPIRPAALRALISGLVARGV